MTRSNLSYLGVLFAAAAVFNCGGTEGFDDSRALAPATRGQPVVMTSKFICSGSCLCGGSSTPIQYTSCASDSIQSENDGHDACRSDFNMQDAGFIKCFFWADSCEDTGEACSIPDAGPADSGTPVASDAGSDAGGSSGGDAGTPPSDAGAGGSTNGDGGAADAGNSAPDAATPDAG